MQGAWIVAVELLICG